MAENLVDYFSAILKFNQLTENDYLNMTNAAKNISSIRYGFNENILADFLGNVSLILEN